MENTVVKKIMTGWGRGRSGVDVLYDDIGVACSGTMPTGTVSGTHETHSQRGLRPDGRCRLHWNGTWKTPVG